VGIRESLNRNPAVVTGATVAVVVIALVLIFWQSRTKTITPPTKAYFTIDDGQSVFEDDLEKTAPFAHDGAQAVQAHMFSCNNGRTKFVGFLEKQPDKAPQPAAGQRSGRDPRFFAALVKPPMNKDAKWVSKLGPEGAAIIAAVRCPEGGSGLPMEVFAN
jgi:hypothetical protein